MPRRISLSVRQTFQQADASLNLNSNSILPKKPPKAVSLKCLGRWFGGRSLSQKNEPETEHNTILPMDNNINSNHNSHKKARGPTPAHKRHQLRKQREEGKKQILRNSQDNDDENDNNNNNSFGEDDTISTVDTVKQTNCHHRRNSNETTATTPLSTTTKTKPKTQQKQRRNLKRRIRKRSASDKKEQAKHKQPPSVFVF